MHVSLLGDSIFDNAAYTRGEPDVAAHLRRLLPHGSRVTLLAVDGSSITDMARQLQRLPVDATHLVVAVGGNDALRNVDLLERQVSSTRETLLLFSSRLATFENAYRTAVHRVTTTGVPVAACTIYNGHFEGEVREIVRVALTVFNDAILRVLFDECVDVIDLRLICTKPSDYANPIEPSGPGGLKIAMAIARALGAMGNGERVARVFGR